MPETRLPPPSSMLDSQDKLVAYLASHVQLKLETYFDAYYGYLWSDPDATPEEADAFAKDVMRLRLPNPNGEH